VTRIVHVGTPINQATTRMIADMGRGLRFYGLAFRLWAVGIWIMRTKPQADRPVMENGPKEGK
jgi:hypothetical protein